MVREHHMDGDQICGTVCCAIGWLPKVDPETFVWVRAAFLHVSPRFRSDPDAHFSVFRSQLAHYLGMSPERLNEVFYNIAADDVFFYPGDPEKVSLELVLSEISQELERQKASA